MKVALIHYWLTTMRGGERVLQALAGLYPQADIFAHVIDPALAARAFPGHRTQQTFIGRLPRARTLYPHYLPLMPLALEHLDLRGYDLIISSESGPAKGVIPPHLARHVCYCHTPMRYLWDLYPEYRAHAGLLSRLAMPPLAHWLRLWDTHSAARVDDFIANSHFVAARIKKYYRREATVIHPPVDVEAFCTAPEQDDYYLMLGQLVPYKRPDLAVRAFSQSGRRLVVVGEGSMLPALKRMAGPSVEFLGRQPFERIRTLYARAQALVFPGVEDFGMVPVEAMASGRPVIARGAGGALETVIDGETGGRFFDDTPEALLDAVRRAEATRFDPVRLRAHAQHFSTPRFVHALREFLAPAR